MGPMRLDIRAYDEVTSTNDLVKRAIADGAPEGTVVVARAQTGGYGRRGNAWASAPGGLYLSVLLRPQRPAEEMPTLSLVAALAVRRALASFLPDESRDIVQVKWPNDVVIVRDSASSALEGAAASVPGPSMFEKICGISLEGRQDALCVGIGVNVQRVAGVDDAPRMADAQVRQHDGAEGAFAASLPAPCSRPKNIPVYLEDLVVGEVPTVDAVRDAVLDELACLYDRWGHDGFGALRDEFMRHFALEGFKIRIDETGDSRPVRCEVRDINERGHLVVLPEGESSLREIAAGTVTIVA